MKTWINPQNAQDEAKEDISYNVEHKLGAEIFAREKMTCNFKESHLPGKGTNGLEL